MTRRFRLRRLTRIGLWTGGLFALLALIAFSAPMLPTNLSEAAEARLSTATTIATVIGASAAVISAGLVGYQLWRRDEPDGEHLLLPHLLKDDALVDRERDIAQIVKRIDDDRVVNCWGRKGVGKSFLLQHLADVVNGHRQRRPRGGPKPKRLRAALYFDLTDAVGFDQVERQVTQTALRRSDARWEEFVASVAAIFGRRRLLLVLDNVNTPGLWPSVGRAIYEYLARRPHDRVVLGSIDPVSLMNLRVEHVCLRPFDPESIGELVAARGHAVTPERLADLHDQCSGLPLYAHALAAHDSPLLGDSSAGPAEALFEQDLVSRPPEVRELIAYAALMGLVGRVVPTAALGQFPIAQLEAQLQAAEPILQAVPHTGRRFFRIHDLFRDAALRVLRTEVSCAARDLFARARSDGRMLNAAIYAMFAEPAEIGEDDFDDVLAPVIRSAVESRNYALLSNLHSWSRQTAAVLRFITADVDRHDLFIFGRASELAGLGRYAEAQEELASSSIARARRPLGVAATQLDADLRFLQADIAHLQNRYNEAREMFEALEGRAATTGNGSLEARCIWGQAHVLRHQGRELDTALLLFARAIELADAAGELFAKVYSVTGATGIKVFSCAVPGDEEQILDEVEKAIATNVVHPGYMLEVWKSQAQVAWFRGDAEKASAIVEEALKKALALNDRLLYNLCFERAEFRRLAGDTEAALEDYVRVLEFGERNGDRNLISNSLLGAVLTDLAAGSWQGHDSDIGARAAALRAREIAYGADIHATAHVAERVTAMLDARGPETARAVRLILF